MVSLNPFVYTKLFGMNQVLGNISNKIWVFTNASIDLEVLEDHDQFLHCKLTSPVYPTPLCCTFVYAKCGKRERLVLWDGLRSCSVTSSMYPWVVGVISTLLPPLVKNFEVCLLIKKQLLILLIILLVVT